MKSGNLAPLLESFFVERLMHQRQASPHTINSYRDTFRLLLQFAQRHLHKSPSHLALDDIDAPLVSMFLNDLQNNRRITPRTRNLRLAAIRSFFHYAAYQEPAYAEHIQRVLAIPGKRYSRTLVQFLNRPEIDALLAAPDQRTWVGRRDHAILLVAIQTGLRLSELTGLKTQDLHLQTGAHVRCLGKGRKERCTPLTKITVAILNAWLVEVSEDCLQWLFPSTRGGRLSADAVQDLVAKYVQIARHACPSLRQKRVSPHTLRHTAAMELLQAGVDSSVIALWLGHESIETTQIYIDADLALKEKALAKMAPTHSKYQRFRAEDSLLTFLKSL